MKNLILKTKLMAIVVGGLWVILPATTYADADAVLQDIAGRVTSANGSGSGPQAGTTFRSSTTPTNWVNTYPNVESVTWGTGTAHFIRDTRNTNTLYYVTQTQTLSAVWENPSTLNTNQSRIRLGSSSSYAIFPRVKPATTFTLQTIYVLDNVETVLSSTTPDANSTITLQQPNFPNVTFQYWQINGVNQSSSLPFNYTITTNTIVKYFFKTNPNFNFSVTNPSTNTKPVALSVWSSVKGNILLGHVIQIGQVYSGSIPAIGGEKIRVTIDGNLVQEYTFPVENPSSVTFQYLVPNFLEGEAEPSPTPPSAEPPSLFPTNTPPVVNPVTQPPNPLVPTNNIQSTLTNTSPNLGGGNATTGNTIPNPFGTFNSSNAPTGTSQDLYGVIKRAVQDAQNENGPTETIPTDTTQLNNNLNTNASNLNTNLGNTASKINQITGEISELSTNVSNLANAFAPRFPSVGTTSSIKIDIPLIGSFNLNISQLPGINLFRNITTFFLWLMAVVIIIHIVRRGIA